MKTCLLYNERPGERLKTLTAILWVNNWFYMYSQLYIELEVVVAYIFGLIGLPEVPGDHLPEISFKYDCRAHVQRAYV
jgi:hypothetical protein